MKMFAKLLVLTVALAVCSCQETDPNINDSTPQITFEIEGKIREEYGGRVLNTVGLHSKAEFWKQRSKRSSPELKTYFDGTITIRTPAVVHTIGVNASVILTPEPSSDQSQTDSNRLKREVGGRPDTLRFFVQFGIGEGPSKVTIGLRARLAATQLVDEYIRRESDEYDENFVRNDSVEFAGTLTAVSHDSAESVGVLFNVGTKPVENDPRRKRSDEQNKPELKFEGNLTSKASWRYGSYTAVIGLEGEVSIEDMSGQDDASPAKEFFETNNTSDFLIEGEGKLTTGINTTTPLNGAIFTSVRSKTNESGERRKREVDVENSNTKPIEQLEFIGKIGGQSGYDRKYGRKPGYVGVVANVKFYDLGSREI